MTKEDESVLQRDKGDAVNRVLQRYAYSVKEAVNYGTTILVWPYRDTNPETNVTKLFLRYFLEQLDALSILIEAGAAEPCKSLLRSLFEINLYVQFMYDEQTMDRVNAFWVVEKYKELEELDRMNPKSAAYALLKAEFKAEGIIPELGAKINGKEIRQRIAEVQAYLKEPQLKTAIDAYDALKAQGAKRIKWYNLFNGVNSVSPWRGV